MDVVLGLLTFLVAVVTCWIAILTYRSQRETGLLQRQTRDSQRRSEKSLERATEIQDRMDARDLEFRKSRADVGLVNLVRRLENIVNIGREDWMNNFDETMVNGWQEEVAQLPDCSLKEKVTKVFAEFVKPPQGPGIAASDGFVFQEVVKLHRSRTQFQEECREKIKVMR